MYLVLNSPYVHDKVTVELKRLSRQSLGQKSACWKEDDTWKIDISLLPTNSRRK